MLNKRDTKEERKSTSRTSPAILFIFTSSRAIGERNKEKDRAKQRKREGRREKGEVYRYARLRYIPTSNCERAAPRN